MALNDALRRVIVFLVLAFALSTICYVLVNRNGGIEGGSCPLVPCRESFMARCLFSQAVFIVAPSGTEQMRSTLTAANGRTNHFPLPDGQLGPGSEEWQQWMAGSG